MRPQFTLRRLLLATALVACGLFALLNGSPLGATCTVLVSCFACLTAILATFLLPPTRRPFPLGYAVFASAVWLLTLGSPERYHRDVESFLDPWWRVAYQQLEGWQLPQNVRYVAPGTRRRMIRRADGSTAVFVRHPDWPVFRRVCDALFAIVSGLLGGCIACWLAAKRDQRPEPAT